MPTFIEEVIINDETKAKKHCIKWDKIFNLKSKYIIKPISIEELKTNDE